MHKTKISLSWSGGKDCAYALYLLRESGQFEVVGLHTTIGEETRRVSMHGIHESLLDAQALSLGLPLEKLYLPASGDNLAYENVILKYLEKLEVQEVRHVAYGDILLEDLKKYREEKLAEKGFLGVFPLWNKDTFALSREFIHRGFRTKICAEDVDKIDEHWIGRDFTLEFLQRLKPGIDPCGENGEFHTFCYDGPVFQFPVNIRCVKVIPKDYEYQTEGGIRERKTFLFADLILT